VNLHPRGRLRHDRTLAPLVGIVPILERGLRVELDMEEVCMRGMEWGGLGSWVDWTVRAAIVGLVSWDALGLGPSDCLRWPGPSLVDCFGSDRLALARTGLARSLASWIVEV